MLAVSPKLTINLALLYYDFIVTFPDEVKCIWQRKFTGATVLFFFNRYGALLLQLFHLVDDLYIWGTQTEEAANMASLSLFYFSMNTPDSPQMLVLEDLSCIMRDLTRVLHRCNIIDHLFSSLTIITQITVICESS